MGASYPNLEQLPALLVFQVEKDGCIIRATIGTSLAARPDLRLESLENRLQQTDLDVWTSGIGGDRNGGLRWANGTTAHTTPGTGDGTRGRRGRAHGRQEQCQGVASPGTGEGAMWQCGMAEDGGSALLCCLRLVPLFVAAALSAAFSSRRAATVPSLGSTRMSGRGRGGKPRAGGGGEFSHVDHTLVSSFRQILGPILIYLYIS